MSIDTIPRVTAPDTPEYRKCSRPDCCGHSYKAHTRVDQRGKVIPSECQYLQCRNRCWEFVEGE